jgi:hypothetical protein
MFTWALGAGAAVSNPGPITITIHDGTLTTALGAFSPLSGTMTGTVDASGNIMIPEANISFASFDVDVTNPIPLTVHVSPVASGPMTGTINPDTGVVTLSGSLSTNLGIATLGIDACPLGPFSLSLSTANTGGVPYSTATGDSTVADNTFVIPAIPDGQAGCAGLEGAINSALALPTQPGAASLVLGAQFSPVLEGATTTTAGPTTAPPTTAPPTTAPPTTAPPTTAPPTTAPPTTAPPTTAAPTTTTVAGVTTTAAPTTTTLPPPEECKPGYGHGDKNHVHCGPPGLANAKHFKASANHFRRFARF